MGMFLFIVALVAFLIALAGVGFALVASDPSDRTGGIGTAVVALIVGLILTGLASVTIVGPRNIGVVTTFGKVSDESLDSGLHWKAPWSSVTDMDGTLQTTRYVGQESTEEHPGCIGVRISDGQTACVSVVTQTQTRIEAADELFVDYRQADDRLDGDINDAINEALVRTQLTSALGEVFGSFDPLRDAGITSDAAADPADGIDYAALSDELIAALNDRLAQGTTDGEPAVTLERATITFVYFADKTQDRINQYQEEVAKTRIAEQRKATAEAEAAANRELSASISNDPNVLVSKCLDLVAEGFKPGFSCWPLGESGPALTTPVR